MNRRSFLAGLGAALLLPEPKRVRAYSFLPGDRARRDRLWKEVERSFREAEPLGPISYAPLLAPVVRWPHVIEVRTADEYRRVLGKEPPPEMFAPKMISIDIAFRLGGEA